MNTRRTFFRALFDRSAVAAGAMTLTIPPHTKPSEIDEIREAVEKLRVEMEKPITLRLHIEGKEIAQQTVNLLPGVMRQHGL